MNTKKFGIEYPANFPLSESAFQKIVFKLLCNMNISARGAQLILKNNELWGRTSTLFDKLDFEVADFEEDDLRKMINELRFLKHCVSGCSCDMHDKAVFKLVSWIDFFDSLTPKELKSYCNTLKVDYTTLLNAQLSHICNTPNEKILRYLSLWWQHTPEKDINLLLDIINQQKLVCDQDKTLATKS